MTQVVSVQFRGRGKSYYFDPAGIEAKRGDLLVVETSKGLELGECTQGNHAVDDGAVVQPLRPVIRMATADDRRVAEINRKREKEALQIAEEKILKHGLEMKLVDVECSFEGNKILFFFTADGRVDFRELVKDLAGVFRTRIELRQIGVRDEAKMLGGIGICGQPFCCSRFLTDFQPVSTKMAKTQSMSLNPAKISGCCGRLMCCLRYEQEAYEDLVKHVPKNGAFVETEDGYGNVVMVNLLRQSVKVKLDGSGDPVFHTYSVDDIAEIPGGRPPEGEPLPRLLQPKLKKKQQEAKEDEWAMPALFADFPVEEKGGAHPEGEKKGDGHRRNRRGHGKKPAGDKPKAEKSAEKPRSEKPRGEKKPAPRPKPQEKPRAQTAESAAAPAPKKNRRRHYGRPRSKQGGENA
ncbi:MAG: hypothetical protein IJE26_00165 [Oscillospiraceae bacterium]|nr:hypothetical protein [Oscillospiraceae bacterium]